jgi:DNA repair photolyase
MEENSMKQRQDWAEKTVNFVTGCENDCRYCYDFNILTAGDREGKSI